VVDEADQDLANGEVGDGDRSRPECNAGLLEAPEATAEALRGGWMHTGDVGRLDNDATCTSSIRKKDVIISGGENVYSTKSRRAVRIRPVLEAAVIGVPDSTWGEAVKAVVVFESWPARLVGRLAALLPAANRWLQGATVSRFRDTVRRPLLARSTRRNCSAPLAASARVR